MNGTMPAPRLNSFDFPMHDGVRWLIRDLNHLYRRAPALHEIDFEHHGFEWISANDSDNSVIAFLRRGHDRAQAMLCVCNFTLVRHDYRLGAVPGPGRYHERINTDSEYYGGSNVGNPFGIVNASRLWHTEARVVGGDDAAAASDGDL